MISIKNSLNSALNKNKQALTSKTAKIGSYNFLITVIVLLILIGVNVLFSALPSTITQFDISAAQLYSLTSSTKVVVNNLEKDVTIYWIVQSGQEDSVIEKLLDVYDDMSEHITVVKKNPDVYPTFAQQYTEDYVSNNSLVVECGDKYRFISYNDIYEVDSSSYYMTGSASSSFDGESEITTAIDYVVSEDLPKVYVLTGHGESELSSTFTDSLEKANIETEEFSLLNVDEIPEDADMILINSPTSDLSSEEVTMLEDYIENEGHLLVLSGPLQDDTDLSNLQGIIESLGVSINDGVVVEGNRDYYAFSQPYILLPEIESSDITDALINEKSNVIVPIASGLTVDSSSSSYTVTSLLTTSADSFSKIAGYSLETYEKEDGDIDGPFSLAVSVASELTDGKLVWVASDVMLDDGYNSYSSGANVDFIMNSISWMIGEEETISIRSKSLDYNYLTISETAAKRIKIIMIFILPIGYLVYGIDEVFRRRKEGKAVEA